MDQEKIRKAVEKIAEKLINQNIPDPTDHSEYLTNLSVYQIELELQNEELKRTSDELTKSNKRFTDLFEHAPVGYLLLDNNFTILDANITATQLLQMDISYLKGKSLTRLIHPQYQDDFYFLRKRINESEQLQTTELKLITKSGDTIMVQLQCIKEPDSPNKENRIRLVLVDITERKKIEKKLRRFRAALDSTMDNVLLLDYDSFRIIDANDSALKNTGMTLEELSGRKPYDLDPRFDDEKIIAFRSIYLNQTGKEHITEIRSYKNGEPIDLEVFLKTIFIDDEKIIVVVARDITERKKNQVKLANYAREMEELNASKDRFLSIISHDLRGPFIGLKGYSQMLLEEFDLLSKDEIMDYLGKIHEASKDLYTLVDNLLKWSRLELGKIPYEPMSFNLLEELESLLKLHSSLASKKEITLENRIDRDLYPFADRLMLISVVQNLVGNALKFTRKNGRVVVQTHKEGNKIFFSVEDNGIGMTSETMKKLFTLDKGHTTRGTSGEKGTGFGLIITNEMIRKMGGELHIKSELGKGSVFTFTLVNSQKQQPETT
jgi:two-component system, sensor histidine kinase and response regulator